MNQQHRGGGVGRRTNLRKDPQHLRESLNSNVEKRRKKSQRRKKIGRQKKLDFLRVIEEPVPLRQKGFGRRTNLRKDPRHLRESLNSHVEKRREESQRRREDGRQKKLDFLRVIEEQGPLRRYRSYPFDLPNSE